MMYLGVAGMVCSVGFNAAAACAAIRAGVANFDPLPYWDRKNSRVIGAAVPGLGQDFQFGSRLTELLALAVDDCLGKGFTATPDKIPLLVGLAEPERPGGGGWGVQGVIAQVQKRLGIKFHPSLSAVIPKGHTAAFEALRGAREIMESTDVPGCLVCGVDSYINASSLFWLDQHWRLKRDGHTDGTIPGEAAAVIYVQRDRPSKAETIGQVISLGFGNEKASVLSDEPLQGRGLAEAGRKALGEAGLGFHEFDFRISDVTGENYGFREHALTIARLARVVRSESQPLWHVADSIGDTGAAAGVIQLVMAAAAWAKGYAPGRHVACFTSSVLGARAVAALQSSAA